jgi:hypothetical protein
MVFLKPFVSCLATAGLELKDVEQVSTPVERELVHDTAPTKKNFLLRVAELLVEQLVRGEVDAIAAAVPRDAARLDGSIDARALLAKLKAAA